MKRLLLAGIAQGLLAATLCTGQEATPAPSTEGSQPPSGRITKEKSPTGTLTGTVYCADTNLPARHAQIYLLQYARDSFSQGSATTTDLEGRFALNAVRAGDYYVVAVLRGYVDLLSSLTKSHLDAMSDQDRKRLLGALAEVTISPDQPAQAAIRLERGTGIEGTVQYDDGSPAIGLQINLRLKSHAPKESVAEVTGERSSDLLLNTTDDRGHFRILGVPPGEYLVSVSVPTAVATQTAGNPFLAMISDSLSNMDVYVGGAFEASKAQTIKVDPGGASADADIVIPLSKLHTLRGQVLLKGTNQPPPSASVELLYADTGEVARMAVAPDGVFEIHYVPEDSFILRASANRTPLPEGGVSDDDEGTVRPVSDTDFSIEVNLEGGPDGEAGRPGGGSGRAAELPVTVTGDMDRLTITVPDPPGEAPSTSQQPTAEGATPAQEQPSPQ